MTTAEKRLYSRVEAATYLALSIPTLDRLISAGTIVGRKQGRRTVIDRQELDRYADRLPAIEPRRAG